MNVNKRQLAGRIGEDAACSYLRKLDYQIIARNFRVRNGEIDIVAIDASLDASTPQRLRMQESLSKKTFSQTLVFVEVKTRLSTDYGTPFEAITPWKLRALIRTAEIFKMTHPKLPESMRIDAIAVMLNDSNEVLEVEHLKSITS